MERQQTIPLVFLTTSIVMCIVSICILPDSVITQFSTGGNTMSPKYVAIAIPAILGVGGSVYSFIQADSETSVKGILVSAIGLVLFAIMIIINH